MQAATDWVWKRYQLRIHYIAGQGKNAICRQGCVRSPGGVDSRERTADIKGRNKSAPEKPESRGKRRKTKQSSIHRIPTREKENGWRQRGRGTNERARGVVAVRDVQRIWRPLYSSTHVAPVCRCGDRARWQLRCFTSFSGKLANCKAGATLEG